MKTLKNIGKLLYPENLLQTPLYIPLCLMGSLLFTSPLLSLTQISPRGRFSPEISSLTGLNLLSSGKSISIRKLWLKKTHENSFSLKRDLWGHIRNRYNDSDAVLRSLANDAGLSPYLMLRENRLGDITKSLSHLKNPSLSEIHSYDVVFDGMPLCDYQLRRIQTQGNGLAILGNIPPDVGYLIKREDLQPSALDTEHLLMADYKDYKNLSQCLLLKENENELIPVWEVLATAKKDGLTYKIRLSRDSIFQTEPYYFDVTGKITAYGKNPDDSELEVFSLSLSDPGTSLTNEYFTTKPFSGSRAQESDGVFDYEIDDAHFSEASLFVYGNTIYDWYKEIGYRWESSKPIELVSNAVFSGNVNNALYLPSESSSTGHPQIKVGHGDGKLLQNLTMDIEVTAHEFGHHVVFDYLKSITGESLVLHEGLADYFVFGMTHDACLGDSICPNGSPICWVENQCLRTAENDLQYNDEIYKVIEPHQKGQIVSGTLWDLGLREGVGHTVATNIAFEAIKQFADSSGLADFSVALFIADQNLYDGKYACEIYDVLEARGIDFHLDEISCDDTASLPPISGVTNSGTSVTSAPATSKRSSSQGNCGVVALKANPQSTLNMGWICLFFLPLLPLFRRKKLTLKTRPGE